MYENLIMSEPKKVDEEIILTVMNVPNNMKMLGISNIWIGDTVASVHTSPWDHGMISEANG
jgi:hypothetical protein